MPVLTALLSLLLTFGLGYLAKKRRIDALLALSLILYVILYSLWPNIYLLVFWEDGGVQLPENYYAVSLANLGALYLSVGIYVYLVRPKVPHKNHPVPNRARESNANAIPLFILILSFSLLLLIGESGQSVGFSEITRDVLKADSDSRAGFAATNLLKTYLPCIGLAIIISNWRGASQGKILQLLAWGSLMYLAISNLRVGVRATLLYPFLLYAVYYLVASGPNRKRNLTIGAGLLPICGGVLLVAGIGLETARIQDSRVDTKSITAEYAQTAAGGSQVELLQKALSSAYTKFDANRFGADMLSLTGESVAGWNPIVSSLISPLPRTLFPEKPVPTSADGTYYGIPYYIAGAIVGDREAGMVVPVPPIVIAIWELGSLGILLLVVANVANFGVIGLLLKHDNAYISGLGISMLAWPTCEFVFAPTSNWIRDTLRILLVLATIYGARAILRVGYGRKQKKSMPNS
jgi:hypothetical protein